MMHFMEDEIVFVGILWDPNVASVIINLGQSKYEDDKVAYFMPCFSTKSMTLHSLECWCYFG